MRSARLVPFVAAAALVAAQQDVSGTIHKTATTTRYLTVVQCDSAVARCPASSSSSLVMQPTPHSAPPVTSAVQSAAGSSVDSSAEVPSSVETASAETDTTAAAPQSPSAGPQSPWFKSNSTGSAAPRGSAALSSLAPTEASATSSAEAPPTVPNGATSGFQPGLAITAAAAAVAVAFAAV